MKVKLPNALPVVKKHLQRIRPGRWFAKLKDPRAETNKYWNFQYLLEVITAGMLSGCKNLRAVETLSEIYDTRVSDTTLHNLLVRLESEHLNEAIVRDVKIALRSHELPRESFPVRITAIDGKSIAISEKSFGPNSDPISGGGDGQFRHMALRALHITNETKLFLAQREIPCKGAETCELRPFVDSLIESYGKTDLLEVLSVDAGMVSKQNADYIIGKGLHYIMALKGSQKALSNRALEIFASHTEPLLVTNENQNGKQITRELYRHSCPGFLSWEHVTEVWLVTQTEVCQKTNEKTFCQRYFLTSLDTRKLSDAQVLQAVRMHWNIENNGYWNLDVVFTEDDSPWTNNAMQFVSRLRILVYNTISRLITRRLRNAQARAMSWTSVIKLVEHACCQLRQVNIALLVATPVTL